MAIAARPCRPDGRYFLSGSRCAGGWVKRTPRWKTFRSAALYPHARLRLVKRDIAPWKEALGIRPGRRPSLVQLSGRRLARPHPSTAPRAFFRPNTTTRSVPDASSRSDHNQLGAQCTGLLECLQNGHEISRCRTDFVDRAHDLIERNTGIEQEHA